MVTPDNPDIQAALRSVSQSIAAACRGYMFDQQDVPQVTLELMGDEVGEIMRLIGFECWSVDIVQVGDKLVIRPNVY